MKILHTADIHLGMAFRGLPPEVAKIRRQEQRQIFLDIIDLANKEEVDLLIIAGDLFEKSYANKNLMDFIKDGFSKLNRARVIIVAGNHDPNSLDSFYRSYGWDSRVHIFDGSWTKISLEDGEVEVHGYSFEGYSLEDNVLKNLRLDENKINIVVFHGSDTSVTASKESQYAPFTLGDLQNLKANYCALGHYHGFREVYTNCYYPGCPEPTGFDEEGTKGVIIAKIDKDTTKAEFIPLAKRSYHTLEIDVTGMDNIIDIGNVIKTRINPRDLYKIILKGGVESSLTIDREEILDCIGDHFYINIIDNTHPQYQLDELLKREDALALFIIEMQQLIEESEGELKEIYTQALYIGLDAMVRGEVASSC